jgi:hypothetical protein
MCVLEAVQPASQPASILRRPAGFANQHSIENNCYTAVYQWLCVMCNGNGCFGSQCAVWPRARIAAAAAAAGKKCANIEWMEQLAISFRRAALPAHISHRFAHSTTQK